MDEEWRDIAGWENCYQVSSLGRVRSLHKDPNDRLLALYRNPVTGYIQVKLYKSRVSKGYAVHVLVCIAFHGPRPERHQAAHWDGDRHNNALTNLRWATRAENCSDKERHGTMSSWENLPQAKLTDAQVSAILADERPAKDIAAEYGVSKSLISMIFRGRARRTATGVRMSARPFRPKGDDHYKARLTSDQVIQIRKMYADGVAPDKIAIHFRQTRGNIYNIVYRASWKHIA